MHFVRSEPQSDSGGVHSDVSASDYGHFLADLYRGVVFREPVGLHQVGARQELVGRVHAVEVLSGDIHKHGQTGSGRDEHRVESVVAEHLLDGAGLADHVAFMHMHAELAQVIDLALDDALGKPEFGNAVNEHAAGLVKGLEDMHFVSEHAHIGGDCQPRGACADDCDFETCSRGNLRDRHFPHRRFVVRHEAFEAAYRHRLVLLAEHA